MAKPTVKYPKTDRPTGLKLKRDGNKFTASWTIKDKDYGDGQGFQWRTNKGTWHSVSISKTATKCNFTITTSNWFPAKTTKLNRVQFRVRGNRKTYDNGKEGKDKVIYKPTVSDWSTFTMAIKTPDTPSVTVSRPASETVRFKWEASKNDGAKKWFTSVEWQSMLIENCNAKKGKNLTWKSSKPGWQTGTNPDPTDQKDFVETQVASGSHTRWFRIRSRGPHGTQKWDNATYAKMVWTDPNAATITKAWNTKQDNGGYVIHVKWSLSSTNAKPTDSVKVQYAIATPAENMECPSEPGWNDAPNTNLKAKQKEANFPVDTQCGEDQALYVRVITKHAGNDVASVPKRAAKGYVKAPTNLSVSTNSTTYKASVTCTNSSDIPDSFLAVYYYDSSTKADICIGVITHGNSSATLQCPIWTDANNVGFKVEAVAGSYTESEQVPITVGGVSTHYSVYTVNAVMVSEILTKGDIPIVAGNVSAVATAIPGTIKVSWAWSWSEATQAELSWSDHDDAWTSTDEPQKYTVTDLHAPSWNISGLETGKTWYVRVRLMSGSGDDITYAPYSNIASISLSSAPTTPTLTLSEGVITPTGQVTASWAYVTTDGTPQGAAQIAIATEQPHGVTGATGATGGGDQEEYSYTVIEEVESAQQITLSAEEEGWVAGNTYLLAVRVQSASGLVSDEWSLPVPITIAEPLTCAIPSVSLERQSETVDGVTRSFNALTDLPLNITVTGAGEGGNTTVAIVRSRDYPISRPDEDDYVAFEGETIALVQPKPGETMMEIGRDDFIGNAQFDDGAEYEIVAQVSDGLGQKATAETMVEGDGEGGSYTAQETTFEVHWDHQAIAPLATVTIDTDEQIAELTPVAPTGTVAGDVCDIYRLSADKPELLFEGAEFGTTYVDPYPAIGEHGGHRFVFRSKDGDYITTDGHIAWLDTGTDEGDIIESEYNIIEFAGDRVELQFDVDVTNSWEKDFEETKYLGGNVQGDWNPAVSRSGSIKATTIVNDLETMKALRKLALYAGSCHVRTKDGSSYKANVDVSADYQQDSAHKVCAVSLSITRIDPEAPDGMTLAEWQETHQPEGATGATGETD